MVCYKLTFAEPKFMPSRMESVQTHVLMGSIILAVCFSMSIEGYSGVQTDSCHWELGILLKHVETH